MPQELPRAPREGRSIIWFLILSLLLHGAVAYAGRWINFAPRELKQDTAIELTDLDTNDVEKLGDPNVPEDTPPPEPEPTPPPPQDEPTPPPLDKPPEFEVPQPTPTPAPSATPEPSATPHPSAPKATPAPPKPKTEKPTEHHAPNAAATPGLTHGSATGAPDGTGHGGPRSGTLVRSPKPPYPPQALQMGIRGDVRVSFTVSNGEIVDAKAISGPPMLASAVIRWTKANWKFAPGTNGTFTLPVVFQMQ